METIKYQEFAKLPKSQKAIALSHLRTQFSDSIIAGFWGLEMDNFDKILNELSLPLAQQKPNRPSTKVEIIDPETTKEIQSVLNEYRQLFLASALPRRSGISIALDGEFDSEFLVKRLRKIASLLKNEEAPLRVTLIIEEADQPLAHVDPKFSGALLEASATVEIIDN